MIEFAKMSGEVDGHYVEVKIRTGEHLFAPITTIGTGATIPSEKWIKENKDNFLALVTYEKDMYISPMIIGFFPVQGADSSTYNTVERLIQVVLTLLEQLSKAKVNTMIGPQQFLPDTLLILEELSSEIDKIKSDINSIKL